MVWEPYTNFWGAGAPFFLFMFDTDGMLGCLSPSVKNHDENLATLHFAAATKTITVQAAVNQVNKAQAVR